MAETPQQIAAARVKRVVDELNLVIRSAAEAGVSVEVETVQAQGLGQRPYPIFTARTFAEIE